MDNETVRDVDALAVDAMTAVVGDEPHAARTALTGASFRDLALIVAWADELGRIARQAQSDYENRERREWREASRPVLPGERQALDNALTEHLRSRLDSGDAWTDLRDIVLPAAPYTDAGTKAVQEWVAERIHVLVRDGVLSPDDSRPGDYRIVSVPGQEKTVSIVIPEGVEIPDLTG